MRKSANAFLNVASLSDVFASRSAYVGNGNHAIPNRNERTLEVTLSKPVIPSGVNEQNMRIPYLTESCPTEPRACRGAKAGHPHAVNEQSTSIVVPASVTNGDRRFRYQCHPCCWLLELPCSSSPHSFNVLPILVSSGPNHFLTSGL